MFARFSICLLLLVACGCGAKTVAPDITSHSEKYHLEEGEGVMIILEEYNYDDKYEDEPSERIVKHHGMQTAIQKCLAKAAKKHGVTVHEPGPLLHDPLLVEHEVQKNNNLDKQTHRPQKLAHNLLGVRYLVSTTIKTSFLGDTDFVAEGDKGAMLLGAAKTGTKSTDAKLTIHDVNTGEQVETLWIKSKGKQGWTAGLAVIWILPVPWYWPWWSMTEYETCEAIGKTVINLVSPLKDN